MFEKIVFISDHSATVKLKDAENITMNLMNLHLIFEDETKKVLGEVDDIRDGMVTARFLGEFVDGRFLGGTIRKPRLDANIRVINAEEILLITGKAEKGYMSLGLTPYYEGVPVYLNVNNFFSSHFAIMGNSGSGKSCGISRLFQNMFHDKELNPTNANIIMFDSSGEYKNAFKNINTINPNYHYRFISTNEKEGSSEKLRLPIYLLNEDDLALLLQATDHSQLPIIERMRKLALVFSQRDMNADTYKNHLIAKAIMSILYTNETAPNKRNEIFSILASCSTDAFNLEATIQGIGYTRKFRECFLIDNSGHFSESVLLTEYVTSFIDEELDNYEPKDGVFYTLDTLEKALNFTLISEGWLRNKNTYGDAVTLKVRLHALIVSQNAKFFDVGQYMTPGQFLNSLVNNNGQKYQIVNINLDDIDDDFAKSITKVFSRIIFDYAKGLNVRASIPFHIIVEEAHRYIQNDNDRFLIGYNVFERIAKEGRKYGVILGIITQRPVELSDTVISQCSNFLIFKMNHPVDVEYIRKMVPNISDEIVEKQKTLQSGTCLGFGSAFRIPMIVRMEMPNPAPWSGNCDVVAFWGGGAVLGATPKTSTSPTSTASEQDYAVKTVDTVDIPTVNIPSTMQLKDDGPVVKKDNFTTRTEQLLADMDFDQRAPKHGIFMAEMPLGIEASNGSVPMPPTPPAPPASPVSPVAPVAPSSSVESSGTSLVTFNDANTKTNDPGLFLDGGNYRDGVERNQFTSSGNATSTSGRLGSNIVAAPDVDLNTFENTGTGVEDGSSSLNPSSDISNLISVTDTANLEKANNNTVSTIPEISGNKPRHSDDSFSEVKAGPTSLVSFID